MASRYDNLDALGVTRATLEAVKGAVAKATTAGFDVGTGNAGIDLAPFVSLVPVDTPYYNSTPRVQVAQGSNASQWQTYANSNALQSYGFTAADAAATLMQNAVINQQTNFAVTGVRNHVTLDAIARAMGYDDAYAVGVLQALNQKLIQEDIVMLNGLTFSIGTPAAPVLTDAATGGSIPASTVVEVKVAARSGLNYFAGGSTIASAQASITVGSTTGTNVVTATLSAPSELAAAYDWFVGGFYYTTTSLPTVTITSVPTANQPVPNSPSLPLLAGAGTVAVTSVPTVDTSYDATGYCGLTASILADLSSAGTPGAPATYVAPGTGLSQGAYKLNKAGAQLTVSGPQIEEFNDLLLSIYATWQLSPTRLLMAPQQFSDVSTAILGTVNAVNYFSPTSVAQHRGLVAAGSVPVYVNPTTGADVALQVQPHLAPGTVVAVCDVIPFPGSAIGTSTEVRTTYDNFLFQYGVPPTSSDGGPTGPRWSFEVRSNETFVNYAAPTMGVITGIAPGVAA